MRNLFSCILAGLLALSFAAAAFAKESAKDTAKNPEWGRMYTVRGKVTVRENPSEAALTVRVLKSGQKVRVDFEDAGWAAVFDPAEQVRAETRAQGYVRLPELRAEARPETRLEPASRAQSDRPDKPERSANSDKGAKKPPQKAAQGQDFGELRVADRKMAIRAGRDKDTEFVRLLQAGQRVRVDFQEDGWYAVFAPDEKVRDLKRAWGYGRDKFLVPEKDYAGQPLPERKEPSSTEPASREAATTKENQAKPAQKQKGDDVVAYAVLGRQVDALRPLAPVVLRVRLDAAAPPAPEALRTIAREIWKAERRKNEDLQVEMLLPGMDQGGLAYSVARFHEDGRLREFWWREVVLRVKN
jgi:hypothetical protein